MTSEISRIESQNKIINTPNISQSNSVNARLLTTRRSSLQVIELRTSSIGDSNGSFVRRNRPSIHHRSLSGNSSHLSSYNRYSQSQLAITDNQTHQSSPHGSNQSQPVFSDHEPLLAKTDKISSINNEEEKSTYSYRAGATNNKEALSIREEDTFNRKKKKQKGFFKRIRFRKYYKALAILSFIGSIIYAGTIIILSIVFPSLQYCKKDDAERCRLNVDTYMYDIPVLVIGCTISLILLCIVVLLIAAPGAIMYPNPRLVKNTALFSTMLLFWPTAMIISPVITRRNLVVPYQRVREFNFTSYTSNNTMHIEFQSQQGFGSDYVVVRVYSTLLPWKKRVSDYSPWSSYYVYSDKLGSDVRNLTTIQRSIANLQHGKTYAIMILPAAGIKSVKDVVISGRIYTYLQLVSIDNNSTAVKNTVIDKRLIHMCKFDRFKGCR